MKFWMLIFTCFLLAGCITVQPSGESLTPVEEEEPEIVRLTQERVEVDEGVTYLIVTFPAQSKDHEGFLDEETGEYVVIGILPSSN